MNKLFISGLVTAMSVLVLLPPLPVDAQCTQNLTDVDDSIIVCSNTASSRTRLRIRQQASVGSGTSLTLNSGGNIIAAGDDIKDNVGSSSGAVNLNFTQTIRTNVINLTFN